MAFSGFTRACQLEPHCFGTLSGKSHVFVLHVQILPPQSVLHGAGASRRLTVGDKGLPTRASLFWGLNGKEGELNCLFDVYYTCLSCLACGGAFLVVSRTDISIPSIVDIVDIIYDFLS